MQARAMSQADEWEIELVLATRGNCNLLRIVTNMIEVTKQKQPMLYDKKWRCEYISHTTGPRAVAKYLKKKRL